MSDNQKKTGASYSAEALKLFCDTNRELLKYAEIKCAASVNCPITLVQANVEEYQTENYDMLEYYVLKLYAIGYRKAEHISWLSGLNLKTVEKILKTEKTIYNHIDISTGDITDLGRKTLRENIGKDSDFVHHTVYNTKRNIQVDAVTGTVIAGYMEDWHNKSNVCLDEQNTFIPRDSVEITARLQKEINERIKEYRSKDIIRVSDFVCRFDEMEPIKLFYRSTPLVILKGMKYPMFVLKGQRRVTNVNSDSKARNNYDKKPVASILSISESDACTLGKMGCDTSELLVREDSFFEYLHSESAKITFDMELPQTLQEE